MSSEQSSFSGITMLKLVFGISSLWDGFTTVYGTTSILKGDDTHQIIAGVLLGAIILVLLYNTPTVLNYKHEVLGAVLKILWACAIIYDFITSFIGNQAFLITSNTPDEIQKFVLFGLTLFVIVSPIILSLLMGDKYK